MKGREFIGLREADKGGKLTAIKQTKKSHSPLSSITDRGVLKMHIYVYTHICTLYIHTYAYIYIINV